MACGMHKKVTIKPNDTIVLSSNPIPGNEKAVSGIINELSMKGANVIFPGRTCIRSCLVRKRSNCLLPGKTEVCRSGAWRVPSSFGTGESGRRTWHNKDNIFILTSGDVLE